MNVLRLMKRLSRRRPAPLLAANRLLTSPSIRRIAHSLGFLPEDFESVHCIGDSHLRYFDWVARHALWLNTRYEIFMVPGATAMGMANPNSRTNALQSFSEYLAARKPVETVLTMLGEVDCGFVIWYRADKYGESPDSQLERSFFNYTEFLDNISALYGCRIIVSSIPLPTIIDGQDWGEVANLRKEVTASLRERTDLTIRYNDMLSEFCTQRGYEFLDFTSPTLDPETGVISQTFLENDPLDHHLSSKAIAPLIVERLRNLGFS